MSFIKPVSEQVGSEGLAESQWKSIRGTARHGRAGAGSRSAFSQANVRPVYVENYAGRKTKRFREETMEQSRERSQDNNSLLIWWDSPIRFSTEFSLTNYKGLQATEWKLKEFIIIYNNNIFVTIQAIEFPEVKYPQQIPSKNWGCVTIKCLMELRI